MSRAPIGARTMVLLKVKFQIRWKLIKNQASH